MSAHAVNKRISAQIFVQGLCNSVAIVCIQNLENVRNVTYPLFSLTPSIALELPTIILLRKLAFLQRLLRDDAVGVGVEVLHTCVDDIETLCLVKECVELEE